MRKGINEECSETGFPDKDEVDYTIACPENSIVTGIKHGLSVSGHLHYNFRCCKVTGVLKNCRDTEMFKSEKELQVPYATSMVGLESRLDGTDGMQGILFKVCDLFNVVSRYSINLWS